MSKIAFIGAASHVFGPSMIKQALIEQRLDGLSLALHDVDREGMELMADVCRTTARSLGLNIDVSCNADLRDALDGADFVLCSAAVEGIKRFATDCEIISRLSPGHQVSEFGGVAGISYSLRQIALTQKIAAQMHSLCPKAWLLTVSNPLPRVCQAASILGISVAGFCSVSSGILGAASMLLDGRREKYPWSGARERYRFRAAGVNHFSWLLEFGTHDGQNLLPQLLQRFVKERQDAEPRRVELIRKTGYCPLPGEDHFKDFLAPAEPVTTTPEVFHGDPTQRSQRRQWLASVAKGNADLGQLPEESWERPMDLIASMLDGRASRFNSINLPNAGQVTNLPLGAIVETPATGGRQGPVPQTLTLPDAVLPYAAHTAKVTDAIVSAALARSRRQLAHAVELDPTIRDKSAGLAAMEQCLIAHADLLGHYE